jgi:hypothetical protein
MEAATSFEKFITMHHSALLHIPEVLHLHLHRSDNLAHRTQHLLHITAQKFAFRPIPYARDGHDSQNYSDYCARRLVA